MSLISLHLSLMHVLLIRSRVALKFSSSCCFEICGSLETFSFFLDSLVPLEVV